MSETAPLLSDQGAADLAPLRKSHEADQLETELKGLFMALFAQFVRPGLDAVSTVGAPHLGDLDQLERAVKMDGIALQRSDDAGAMRYLHKSFRARNPKRGLHMLRVYLQVLFGAGNWEVVQMWQDAALPYPDALFEQFDTGRFLTGRVSVRVVSSEASRRPELLAQALRSVLPARMLMGVSLMSYPMASTIRLVAAVVAVATRAKFSGTFIDPPFRVMSENEVAVFQAATASAVRLKFTGNLQ